MVAGNSKYHHHHHILGLPRLESVSRISSIPVVESSLKTAGNVYERLKKSNRLLNWGFETAETTLLNAVISVRPAVKIIEGPLHRIDDFMCKSLDLVEKRIPVVCLPPQLVYWNTKEYMSDHLVRPVLKRARSVTQLGTAVLDSRVSNFAADRIDGALDVADKYVERYLPDNMICTDQDVGDGAELSCSSDDNQHHMIQALHRGRNISKKFKRRLTQRTIAEAQALKKQSRNAIHVLFYVAEMIATDPQMAIQKARELWNHLSENEPGNQQRPTTLDQLISLLTRETARRIVHLVNFTAVSMARIPRWVVDTVGTHNARLFEIEVIFVLSKIATRTHSRNCTPLLLRGRSPRTPREISSRPSGGGEHQIHPTISDTSSPSVQHCTSTSDQQFGNVDYISGESHRMRTESNGGQQQQQQPQQQQHHQPQQHQQSTQPQCGSQSNRTASTSAAPTGPALPATTKRQRQHHRNRYNKQSRSN